MLVCFLRTLQLRVLQSKGKEKNHKREVYIWFDVRSVFYLQCSASGRRLRHSSLSGFPTGRSTRRPVIQFSLGIVSQSSEASQT